MEIALYEIKRKIGATSSTGYAKKLKKLKNLATVTSLRFSPGPSRPKLMLRSIILWCNLVRVIQV
jgi:hypothetical protein